MKINKNKHFTLIELIVVIAVLGILASIVLPNISDATDKAEQARLKANVRNLQTVVDAYRLDNNSYPTVTQPKFSNGVIDFEKIVPDYLNKKDFALDKDYRTYYVDSYGNVVVNYNDQAEFLEWVKTSPMIVSNPNDPVYNGLKPPKGMVLLNYDIDSGEFKSLNKNPRSLTISTAVTGDSLLTAYKVTKNPVYLEKAELIGDFLLSQIVETNFWGNTHYGVAGLIEYTGNSWVSRSDEMYSKDCAMTAKFLIELEMLREKPTGVTDTKYADGGKKLLDTLVLLQHYVATAEDTDYHEISGALPEVFYRSGGINWRYFPMDIAYMVVESCNVGDFYFKTDKYSKVSDNYVAMLERAFEDYNGVSEHGYPYEYLIKNPTRSTSTSAFIGANENQLMDHYDLLDPARTSPTQPFTTDQFYYTTLGLARAKSPYAKKFYDKAKEELMHNNYTFTGQYNIDGTPDETPLETCNTAFMLMLAKYFNDEKLVTEIETSLVNHFSVDETSGKNYGVEWSSDSSDKIVETLATAFSIKSLMYQSDLDYYSIAKNK